MRPPTGPSLPRSILEEIETASAQGGQRKGYQKVSRKEARKQDREQKKQRKVQFFASGRTSKRPAENEHNSSPERKRPRLAETTEIIEQKPAKPPAALSKSRKHPDVSHLPPRNAVSSGSKSETALEKRVRKLTKPPSVIPRSEQENHEDAYIAYLESKLGWSKAGARTSKYGKGLEDDGLDDLLAGIDSIEASVFSRPKSRNDDGYASDGRDLQNVGEDEAVGDGDGEEYDSEGGEEESESGSDESEDEDEEEAASAGEDEDAEWSGFGGQVVPEQTSPDSKVVSENTPGSRYVPPHLRKAAEETEPSEAQMKLTRQLKGLLNRMTEQNISTILDGVEEIYRKERRHDVTSTLTTLIIDGISAHSILLDSYVVLHAAFISSLHKIIGVEFAAYFVQNVVTSYERHFATLQTSSERLSETVNDETLGKECSNLIVLLSELYNFQVISCLLVYDFIRGLLDGDLTEFKVELLLKVVRNSGQQLRTDDPSALKDIIQIVHEKIPIDSHGMSSRAKFMVETLTNLKNNKIKKNAAGAQGPDAVERMKKFLSGLSKKRHVMGHEPLRVSLADLHSAETKGKWWLVGAAWGGDPLVDRQEGIQQSAKTVDSTENILLKLAKKQGMNTDIRRSIFVVLMSSEDYVDACERLSQLKLTEVQQREIIRVLLHCCGNEKTYNPYYAFVAQHLCGLSHSYKVTLQFCLWDFLRDLGETEVGGVEVLKNLKDDTTGFDLGKISNTRMRNVARAYAWWLAKDSCSLAIFKPVDFTTLKPQTRQFFTELFTQLLVNTQLPTPLLSSDPKGFPNTRNRGSLEEVFIKATRIETLALGLVYFLRHMLGQEQEQDGGLGFVKWAVKVATETLRTGIDIVATL
ncbi:hypothetical protein BDW22DRAFT_1357370 [Trametopsis cervina]|nr:hypothetical protein BDW22DRAFT_1357370 [Trametopsis cervina]